MPAALPGGAAPLATSTPQDEAVAAQDRCLIFGPSRAGKTSILAALREACASPAGVNGPLVSVSMRSESEARLLEDWYKVLLGEAKPTGSFDNRLYEVSATVHLRSHWWREHRYAARLQFHDGPGGALFPAPEDLAVQIPQQRMEQFRSQLVEAGRNAITLVLCVQVPQDGGADLELIRNIDSALDALTVPAPVDHASRADTLWQRTKAWALRRPYSHSPMERPLKLPCRRFLLLLNKIDRICDVNLPGVRGDELARQLEPVGQACAVLGEGLLRSIAGRLLPDASFAVGLTSAAGFDHVDGTPFLDAAGRRPRTTQSLARNELVRRWRPFGVREAVTFMVTGECLGAVAMVPPVLRDKDLIESPFEVEADVVRRRLARRSPSTQSPSTRGGED